jgi:hypothetical protein
MCRSHGGEWSWHSFAQDRSRLEALQVQKGSIGRQTGCRSLCIPDWRSNRRPAAALHACTGAFVKRSREFISYVPPSELPQPANVAETSTSGLPQERQNRLFCSWTFVPYTRLSSAAAYRRRVQTKMPSRPFGVDFSNRFSVARAELQERSPKRCPSRSM